MITLVAAKLSFSAIRKLIFGRQKNHSASCPLPEKQRQKMILQSSTTLRSHGVSLSSASTYWRQLPFKTHQVAVPNVAKFVVTCSISQVHSYGTVDYERRPMIKWQALYKKISLMENPDLGSATVLNEFEKGGRSLAKWELCRVIKELRKYKRHKRALEVYEWMHNRGERFRLSVSDAAIQLDLIAKVHGVPAADEFFVRLPDGMKDKRVYGALLHAYVRAKMKEKAESLIDHMRDKGYVDSSLSCNVMMTLYMNLKEYDKVDDMVSEMMQKKVRLDVYSYNIWLSSCGSRGSAEKMEEVYEQMRQDRTINPNWTTYSTLATMYIKLGLYEKAEESLKKFEARITGRDRVPYHYLISLYGSLANQEEIYRVWKVYKSAFPTIPNFGYHAMVSSLVRAGDIEGAEKIYEEWLPVRSSLDPRVTNLIISWYVREGNMEKAKSLFADITEMGGKPTASSWEILLEGHIKERKISEALSCFKEAFTAEGSKHWRPKPVNVSAFCMLCDEEADKSSKEVLINLLREFGHLKDKGYTSLIGITDASLLVGDENQEEGRPESSENEGIEEKDNSVFLLSEV